MSISILRTFSVKVKKNIAFVWDSQGTSPPQEDLSYDHAAVSGFKDTVGRKRPYPCEDMEYAGESVCPPLIRVLYVHFVLFLMKFFHIFTSRGDCFSTGDLEEGIFEIQ